jgi:NitT/TauT family transport system substrate-binding protein
MMVYDKPPFAVVGRKSWASRRRSRSGRPGAGRAAARRRLGAVPDLCRRERPRHVDAITVEPVGFPTREPMLAEGNVAAVTGFSFSSFLNLVRLGVPEDDISVILMADHGVDLYGNAIIVNTDFAAENPEAVSAFLAAVAMGWKDAIADPGAAIDSLIARNPAADAALEQRRLQLAIDANVLTDYVMANGMGGIDADRMANAIEQMALTYEFQNEPDAALYFTDAYLPEGGAGVFALD